MINNKLLKVWRIALFPIFIFVLAHFLKDLTQDILKISTPLDLLGDAKEDLSCLSKSLQSVYLYGLGGLSIVAEIFLLITIPKIWKRKEFTKLDNLVLIVIVSLIAFFILATILDPRYGIKF